MKALTTPGTRHDSPARFARFRLSGVVERTNVSGWTMALLLATLPVPSLRADSTGVLMPVPAEASYRDGRLAVTSSFTLGVTAGDARLERGIVRALTVWQERTGVTFPHRPDGAFDLKPANAAGAVNLIIERDRPSPDVPELGDDESYSLEVTATQATLHATTTVGALRGLATLTELLQGDSRGWFFPTVTIRDQPRFPWRGLLIDVCRHWQPVEVIKRNLDGMALVKLNVLHLHLTEDQGFRVESKVLPTLQQLGSDGHFFTQDQIRELIAYAADRGIRVVPEFDIPGHATSWVVAHPELAGGPGPYVIERRWGVFDPVLDPTNEKTYEVLEKFLGEMAGLFPDPYLHIGGDENNGVQWNANPRIQAFIREHGLKDNAGLHAYFNRRVRDMLKRHGKKMIGWDEILHPDLPKDSIIQSWRGADGLVAAASQGYTAILSNGYYIDLCHPAGDHYRNDPLPAETKLTAEQQARILGGEATMWSEWVTPETIDSRIWPRTAAIAERLWSPRAVSDVADMYRRLGITSRRIEEAGLQHEKNRPAMIRRFAGEDAASGLVTALAGLVDAIEPVKGYERGAQQPNTTQLSPLTGLADCARPESDVARKFNAAVTSALSQPQSARPAALMRLEAILRNWTAVAQAVTDGAPGGAPRISAEAVPIASAFATLCRVGRDALAEPTGGTARDAAWEKAQLAIIEAQRKPGFGVELPIAEGIAKLVQSAAKQRAAP